MAMNKIEEPRDFQLLDDDDDITSSPLFDMNFNLDAKMNDHNSSKTEPNSVRINSQTSNISMTVNAKNTVSSSPQVSRPKPSTKFNISSNKPNTNTSSRLELKSIERPRSNSPMKIKGIEEFVQLYANKQNGQNQNQSSNKIKMNLKMDDLLANVGKNETYQMLSDFSVLTGDLDPITTNSQRGYGKNKGRKKSLDVSSDLIVRIQVFDLKKLFMSKFYKIN